MRYIDRTRKKALFDIKVRARAILIMADEYERVYKDPNISGNEAMENLDEIWRIMTANGVTLGEIIRENSL